MNPDSLKYKVADIVFTVFEKYLRIIRTLAIAGLVILIGANWKLAIGIPLLIILGVSGFIEATREGTHQ